MDNIQVGLEAVIALIRILRDFISVISDFLPKRSSNGLSFNDNAFWGGDA